MIDGCGSGGGAAAGFGGGASCDSIAFAMESIFLGYEKCYLALSFIVLYLIRSLWIGATVVSRGNNFPFCHQTKLHSAMIMK
jgi:hypothetical protein